MRYFSKYLLPCLLLAAACSTPKEWEGQGGTSEVTDMGPYKVEGLDRAQINDQKILAAMSRVPRHRFVPESEGIRAYEDNALSIGLGQTISQPFIVALMSQEAGIGPGAKVLEIGTGSGYQAAVLSELGAKVYSIEILPELSERAAHTLSELGYDVKTKVGDGWEGWSEEAPFDAILVTAASPKVPSKLLAQLANRGRLIVPLEKVGEDGERLMLFERDDENLISRDLGAVRFVPLTGEVRR